MTTIAEINPDTVGETLHEAGLSLVRRLGTNVVIRCQADLEQAVIDRNAIADAIKVRKAFFEEPKKLAHQLHTSICKRENIVLAPLLALDKERATAIRDYNDEQTRLRRQQEQEDAERLRVQEQTRATEEAAALERAGQPELATAVLEEAMAAPVPVVVRDNPLSHIAGLKFRKRWAWKFAGGPVDITQTPPTIVARALAIIPREFLMLDETKVGQYARAMKTAGKIPGIDIYCVEDPIR